MCYHASRMNHLTELLQNWSVHGVNIVVQTFCGLNEITLTVMERVRMCVCVCVCVCVCH